jgi:hypothetical protein
MAITNKLITFNKLTSFETQLAQGNILETSIVFIKDAKKIWTKGTYFDCSGGGSSIPIIRGLEITSSGTLNEEQLAVLNNRPTVFIAQISQPFRGFALFGRIPVGEGDGAFAANIEKDYFVFNYFENNTYSLTQTELALKSDIPNTDDFVLKSELPTKTSDLTNDSGFITADEVSIPENIVEMRDIEDGGEIDDVIIPGTNTDLSSYATLEYVNEQLGNISAILDNIIVNDIESTLTNIIKNEE